MALGQLAPAGTAVSAADLLLWLGRLPRAACAVEEFRAAIRARYGVPHCFLVSSGRAALFLLLQALSRLADSRRREVIVPAYTCYSVPAAAVRAGLRLRPCDVDPRTLSYDLAALERLDYTRVLAVVSANLYGLPNDLPAIEALARRRGVFFIDDAAQCLDARMGGRAAGTFGDAGLYSLDKGKNITSIQGGVLVTRSDEIAETLRAIVGDLPAAPVMRTLRQAAQLAAYAGFLRPWLYPLPASLPFLKLGETVYTTDYPVERYSAALAPLAARLFARITTIGAERRARAQAIQRELTGVRGLEPVPPLPAAEPVYLRLPLLATDGSTRARLLRALEQARLGATGSYPNAIVDVPELRPHLSPVDSAFAGARRIASTILTLPTHHYVSPRHIRRMGSAIRETLVTMHREQP